eukprot:g621.t1
MFLYGQLTVMWRLQVRYFVDIEAYTQLGSLDIPLFNVSLSTQNEQQALFTFTFMQSVQKLEETGAVAAAYALFICSGVWPHVKLLGLMAGWWLPLPARVRQVLLYYLDSFGKSSLADVMVVTIIAVGLEIPVSIHLNDVGITKNLILPLLPDAVLKKDAVDCLVSLGTYPGIYVFCAAVFLSLILSAFIASLVKQAHVEEFGGPTARRRAASQLHEDELNLRGLEISERELQRDRRVRPALATRSILARQIHPVAPYVMLVVPLLLSLIAIGLGIFMPSLHRTVEGYVGSLNSELFGDLNDINLWYSMWDIILMVAGFGGGSIFYASTVFIFGIAVPLIRIPLLLALWLMPISKYNADLLLLGCSFMGTFDATWVYWLATLIVQIEIPELSKTIDLGTVQETFFESLDYINGTCNATNVQTDPHLRLRREGCQELKGKFPELFGPLLPFVELRLLNNQWLYVYFIGGIVTIICSWWISFEVSQILFGNRYAEYPGCFCTCAKSKMYRPLRKLSSAGAYENDKDVNINDETDSDTGSEQPRITKRKRTKSGIYEDLENPTNNNMDREEEGDSSTLEYVIPLHEKKNRNSFHSLDENDASNGPHNNVSHGIDNTADELTIFEKEFPKGHAQNRSFQGKVKFWNTPKNKSRQNNDERASFFPSTPKQKGRQHENQTGIVEKTRSGPIKNANRETNKEKKKKKKKRKGPSRPQPLQKDMKLPKPPKRNTPSSS